MTKKEEILNELKAIKAQNLRLTLKNPIPIDHLCRNIARERELRAQLELEQ